MYAYFGCDTYIHTRLLDTFITIYLFLMFFKFLVGKNLQTHEYIIIYTKELAKHVHKF